MRRYRMTLKDIDNSGVQTRQVRRQLERLAKKRLPGSSLRTRADLMGTATIAFSSSKYMPHQGKREMARRLHRAAAIAAGDTRVGRYWRPYRAA